MHLASPLIRLRIAPRELDADKSSWGTKMRQCAVIDRPRGRIYCAMRRAIALSFTAGDNVEPELA